MPSLRRIKRANYAKLERARGDAWFREWFQMVTDAKPRTEEEQTSRRVAWAELYREWSVSGTHLPFVKWLRRTGKEIKWNSAY